MNRLSIPSALLSAKLTQNVADLRSRISAVSTEATTGQRADLTKHLSGRIGDAMLSQKALQDITSERSTLGIREARLDLVQQSLSGIQTTTNGLSARLLSAVGIGNESEVTAVSRDAKNALEKVFSSLNVRHGERFLFAGDATSTQPFGDTDQLLSDVRQMAIDATDAADFETLMDDYFNSPTGGWQQTIYQGSATASDGDAVTATDPALRKVVAGLATMALAGQDSTPALLQINMGALQSAADKVSEGQVDLTNLRAGLGVTQERITSSQEALDVEETILTEAFTKIATRDQYEAATELRELESNLEASYLLTARLSNLSLMNYLR
ncbi:flagellin [Henriciella sp.]|uniref:flagellin n=1 Tax=Henriciella sp. TaxID=1968823 RepID=UPI002628571F|nr:flagellin [Henriciella sp.]